MSVRVTNGKRFNEDENRKAKQFFYISKQNRSFLLSYANYILYIYHMEIHHTILYPNFPIFNFFFKPSINTNYCRILNRNFFFLQQQQQQILMMIFFSVDVRIIIIFSICILLLICKILLR